MVTRHRIAVVHSVVHSGVWENVRILCSIGLQKCDEHYTRVLYLGKGSSSFVYKAEPASHRAKALVGGARHVVVKHVFDCFTNAYCSVQILREVLCGEVLKHDRIVRIYDVIVTEDADDLYV